MSKTDLVQVRNDYLAKIRNLDFVREIKDGRLSQKRRDYYLAQDHYYLAAFSEATEMVDGILRSEGFLSHARDGYEASAHDALKPSKGWKEIAIGQTSLEYTAFMMNVMKNGSDLQKVLVMLPCLESYYYLAKAMKEDFRTSTEFQDWIQFYTQPAYVEDVNRYHACLEQLITKQDGFKDEDIAIYTQAYDYEVDFWQVCWDVEKTIVVQG